MAPREGGGGVKLRELLGSRAAARFVQGQIADEARLSEARGMTHGAALEQAIREGGAYWVRQFLEGVVVEVDGERVTPSKGVRPGFLDEKPNPAYRQKVLL